MGLIEASEELKPVLTVTLNPAESLHGPETAFEGPALLVLHSDGKEPPSGLEDEKVEDLIEARHTLVLLQLQLQQQLKL